MREIRYRAKTPSGEWLYGVPYPTPLGNWSMRDKSGVGHYIDPETVGQSTGIRDRDGNEIYEGDMIRICDIDSPGMKVVTEVRWNHDLSAFCCWYPDNGRFATLPLGERCDGCMEYEIIGNIHDQ